MVSSEPKYKVLLVASHPVQYAAPVFRLMTQHPRLDPLVAYCSLRGAETAVDPEFGVPVTWDVPLLEGYPWVYVPNRSIRPGIGRFFGLVNVGLWKLVRTGGFDAVVILTGYVYASFWIAAIAAKSKRSGLLFGTDAHDLLPRDTQNWKPLVKRWVWPKLFRLADVVIVPSSRGVALIRSLGIPMSRVMLTPYVVNNDWWIEQSECVDRAAVRRDWGVEESASVVLFCAKLQPWKRPQDVLRAFGKANVPGSHLVYAGEGPLRQELETETKALGVAEMVHFLGFTNQSQLPAVYRASDLLVLPSQYEPFGVVVNEAMLCGCPVVVSDHVGAGYDLVRPGQNGFVFPCGDVDGLAGIFSKILPDRERLRQMGEEAHKRMETWSPRDNIEGLVRAVEKAVQSRSGF